MSQTYRAVAMTRDEVVLDGERVYPFGALGALDCINGLLTRLAGGFPKEGGVLLISDDVMASLGLPGSGFREGWAKFRLPGQPVVNVGLADQLPRCPLVYPKDPRRSTNSLAAWHLLTGHPWFGTPGLAASDVLEDNLKAVKPKAAVRRLTKGGPGDSAHEAALSKIMPLPNPGIYHHVYDCNRQYLAAVGAVEVCPWALRHTGDRDFDKRLAGWWLIEVPAWNMPMLPDPAGYESWPMPGRPPHSRQRWLTTPTVALLAELAEQGLSAGVEVLDSWTGTSRRLFRPWAEKMEGAYQRAVNVGLADIATAIKQAAGREVMGLWNAESYHTYRPDWHYSVIAQARCNLWRKLHAVFNNTGRYPLGVETDAVVYGAMEADPIEACPAEFTLGANLGQFKVKVAS